MKPSPLPVSRLKQLLPALFLALLASLGAFSAISAAANLVAVQTDRLVVDANGDGKASPGDTLEYTVLITNTGTTDALNVVFSENLDPNTTLVPGSLKVSPVAVDDAFSAVGNVRIQVPAGSGLLSNDFLGLPGGTVTPFTGSSAQGGQVVISSDGSFSYDPPAGYEGSDSFNYTVTNAAGANNGQAQITVGGMIWFINNNAGACASGCDGRLTHPFTSLSTLNTANTGAGNNPAAGDSIFIYESLTAYTGPLTLLNNQRLIGQASSSTLTALTGLTPPAYSDALPTTSISFANRVNITSIGNGVVLAQNNRLYGFSLGSMGFGSTALSGASIVNLTVRDVAINTNQKALDLTGGALDAIFTSVTTTGGANNVRLTTLTGSLNLGSGSLSGATAEAFYLSGGSLTVLYTGSLSQGANNRLVYVLNHTTGSLTFNTGTLSASSGTGLGFDNADGTYSFNGTLTLSGGDAGVDIVNGSSGTFTFASTASITNPSGAAFSISNSAPILTYPGTISTNASRPVSIDALQTGGSATFSGNITSTGLGLLVQNSTGGSVTFTGSVNLNTGANAAVTLTSNSSASVSFSGGLVLNSTSGKGFSATGSGNVSVIGVNNTILSGAGTALEIDNVTITAGGVTFKSIASSSGSADGIRLVSTGSGGSLTVTGTGTTAGSGGTITNKTGADGSAIDGTGIYLSSTKNVSLSNMSLSNFDNFAIRGSDVNGLSINNLQVTGTNGNNVGLSEGSLSFTNLLGTATISNSTISGGAEDNLRVVNNTGTLTMLTVSSTTIGLNGINGNDGLHFEGQSAAAANLTVSNSTFSGARGDMLNVIASGTANMAVVLDTNNFINTHSNIVAAGGGLTISGDGAGYSPTLTYVITNNTIKGAKGSAITVNKMKGAGSFSGRIENNVIGTVGAPASTEGDGIFVGGTGSGTVTTLVKNNNIYGYNDAGIFFIVGDNITGQPAAQLNATATGNTIAGPGGFTVAGIYTVVGMVTNDTNQACIDLNNVSPASLVNSGLGPADDIALRHRFATTVRLPGYGGSAYDTAAVKTYLLGRNNTAPNDAIVTTSNLGSGYLSNPGACAIPTVALPSGSVAQAAPDRSVAALGNPARLETTLVKAELNPASETAAAQSEQPAFSSTGASKAIAKLRPAARPAALAVADVNTGPLTLPANERVRILFRVQIANPLAASQVSNQGSVTATGGISLLTDDPDAVGSANPTVTLVDQRSDLQIEKQVSSAALVFGEPITYTIVYTNTGPNIAAGVSITDNVPAAIQVTGITSSGASLTQVGIAPNYVWQAASLAVNAGGTITLTGVANGTGVITNTVTIGAVTGELASADNTSSAAVTLNKAATTLQINLDDPDPSVVGQPVTVTFTLGVTAPGVGTPTGLITVSDGIDTCTASPAAGECSLALTTPGPRTLTASYSGDSHFKTSTDTEAHTVNLASTSLAITSDAPDASIAGEQVTISFTLSVTAPGAGTPTGVITITDGVQTCTTAASTGSCPLSLTTLGLRTLTATYSGNSRFSGSTDTESHTVSQADTSLTISSDTPDPSFVGQPVTVTFSLLVTAPGVGTPTGVITVTDGVDSCTASVAAGQCTLALTTAGNRTLTATYPGSTDYGSSSDTESHFVWNGDTFADPAGLCAGNLPCFTSIQEAIDNAQPGGKATVFTGSYSETVTLNKNVTVVLSDTVTVSSLSILSGTFNVGLGFEITGNYDQSGGAFNGGTGPVTVDGDFSLSGGTFTTPSTSLIIKGFSSRTGGTFNRTPGSSTHETRPVTALPLTYSLADVTVTAQNPGTLTSLQIERFEKPSSHENAAGGGGNIINRYFDITTVPAQATFEVEMCVQYEDAEVVGMDENQLVLCRWNGSQWACTGRGVNSNPATNTLCASSITQFSEWVIGQVGPTNVSLKAFTVQPAGKLAVVPVLGSLLLIFSSLLFSTLLLTRKKKPI